jgi:hypothetical protein
VGTEGRPAGLEFQIARAGLGPLHAADGKHHHPRPRHGNRRDHAAAQRTGRLHTRLGISARAHSVRGFWVACAFCAHGIAGAGGIGKVMAEWIIDGHPEWDMWRLDVRRFGNQYGSQAFTLARTVETYGKYYTSTCHMRSASRRGRCVSLPPIIACRTWARSSAKKAGGNGRTGSQANEQDPRAASVPDLKGWALDNWSPAIAAEHRATRETAALFDETSFSKIEVLGPGACDFLQSLCDNDIDKPAGTVVYTQMLNARGGIECDFTVTRLAPDRFMIVTGTAFGTHDMTHLRRYMPLDGTVYINDMTSARTCFGLWGPRARDILQSITRDDVSNPAFPYMTASRSRSATSPRWHCALPMSASWAGNSTLPPNMASSYGTHFGRQANRSACWPADTRPSNRSASKKATATGAQISRPITLPTKPGWDLRLH